VSFPGSEPGFGISGATARAVFILTDSIAADMIDILFLKNFIMSL